MIDRYDVIWETPSEDSLGSMPVGNGDIGLNVWVEEDGALLILIGKTDSWDENGRLLKLGKVRVTCEPNMLRERPFTQKLRLRNGEIEITAGPEGRQVRFGIWCDANRPAVRMEWESDEPLRLTVTLETWRNAERIVPEVEKKSHSFYGLVRSPHPIVEDPDTVVVSEEQIVWYHRNRRSIWGDTLRHQGLGELQEKLQDPLLHLTSGAALFGDQLARCGDRSLASVRPALRGTVSIVALCEQSATESAWQERLENTIQDCGQMPLRDAKEAHRQWWARFWNRSYIEAAGAEAETVCKGYALQRYLNACAGRGRQPIKFNGSIFTMDADIQDEGMPRENFGPDYRRWGGPYWFQNTRLLYWSMLTSGDYELMPPFFRMYREALELSKERCKLYFGHEGACYPEIIYFWGAYTNDNYGWNREGKDVSYVENTYIRYYWAGALELLAMMLVYDAHTGYAAFRRDTLLPMAEAILDFYDYHFVRSADGKLHLERVSALETWIETVNPTPDIAGLQYVLDRLLALDDAVSPERLVQWRRLRSELPSVPTMEDYAGEPVIVPAEQLIGPIQNMEHPELYAVFPYPLFALGTSGEEIGRRTFAARREKKTSGWRQDAIQAAYLGLAESSWQDTATNFCEQTKCRFPVFWDAHYDWIPDQDHGSVSLIALQSMLLQSRNGAIYVLPAWPKDKNVKFKLYAEAGTVVEVEFAEGAIRRLDVSPPERRASVIVRSDISFENAR